MRGRCGGLRWAQNGALISFRPRIIPCIVNRPPSSAQTPILVPLKLAVILIDIVEALGNSGNDYCSWGGETPLPYQVKTSTIETEMQT